MNKTNLTTKVFLFSEYESHIKDIKTALESSGLPIEVIFLQPKSDFSNLIPEQGIYVVIVCPIILAGSSEDILSKVSIINNNFASVLYVNDVTVAKGFGYRYYLNRSKESSYTNLINAISNSVTIS